MKNYSKIVEKSDRISYYDTKNRLHRIDGPANILKTSNSNTPTMIVYYIHGRQRSLTNNDGYRHWLNKKGELHRTDGPAIEWVGNYINGKELSLESYKKLYPNAFKNRQRIETDELGGVYYYNNENQYHREDGPAVAIGNVGYTFYYINGKLSNLNGPDFILDLDNGGSCTTYYINGLQYSEPHFNNRVFNCPNYLKIV